MSIENISKGHYFLIYVGNKEDLYRLVYTTVMDQGSINVREKSEDQAHDQNH